MQTPDSTDDCMSLLVPEALGRLANAEIIARGAVAGFIAGRHTSPFKGFSVEFAEHRQYAPGDDLRNLDWRVLGKTDRYYVKEYVEETNLRATIVVDASGSMGYRGDAAARLRGRRLSKIEYARHMAATLSHLLLNQRDAVGLTTFDAAVRRYIPARSRTTHLRAILEELYATEAGSDTSIAPVLHDIAERIHRRGLVIIISDFFDDPEEIVKALHHFRYRRHEVICMHVMAEEERTFPFDGQMLFNDLEGVSERIQLDARAIRAAYLDQVRGLVDTLRRGCGTMQVDYVPMSTEEPFDGALARYLSHRRSLTV